MKKTILALLLSLCAFSLAVAQTTTLASGWKVQEVSSSDPSFRETGNLDGFSDYSGGPIPRSGSISDRKVVLVQRLSLTKPTGDSRLALLVGASDYPCDVYFNGHLLGHMGFRSESFYNSTVYYASRYAIDPALITGDDTLVVEAFPTYETTAIPVIRIGNWNDVAKELFWRNLFNVSLIQASVCFAIILGAFFILLYIMGTHDKKYLWFIFICFSFALSYTNMSLYNDGQDVMLYDKMTRCGMPLTSFLLFMFAREFTGFRYKSKNLGRGLIAVLGTAVAASCLVTIFGSGKEFVFTTFSAYTTGILMPVLLVLTLILLVYGLVKRPGADTAGVVAGFSILIAAGVHDIVISVSGGIPFSWLAAYGYLGFVLSIFFVLALDQATVLARTSRQARIMETQHEALTGVVRNLTQVSEGLVSSSKVLSDTVSDTIAVVENYGLENRAILDEFGKQAKSVEEQIDRISRQLAATADRVPEAIANQTKAAKGVNESLRKFGERITGSLGAVEQSNGFIAALAANADSSRRVVQDSREALARVENTSNKVKTILGAIGELSEQTNVLSINAAIESARYGNAGKGFAVIAQEIRKFSSQSQVNLQESFIGVQAMSEAIAETIKNHDAVQKALNDVITKSHMAAEQSMSINRMVREQEEESRTMAQSADRMIEETNTLETISHDERAMTEDLKQTLSGISKNFDVLSLRLENQGAMKDTLFNAIEQMRAIMRVNEENIGKLKTSIQKAQDANLAG
jgi:methyl-accepting chemotaxis protein